MDVNEITMNMVPFPRLHFMTASMAPIWAPGGPRAMRQPRGLEQMFTDVLQPKSMLVRSQPKAHTTLVRIGRARLASRHTMPVAGRLPH